MRADDHRLLPFTCSIAEEELKCPSLTSANTSVCLRSSPIKTITTAAASSHMQRWKPVVSLLADRGRLGERGLRDRLGKTKLLSFVMSVVLIHL